MDAISLSPSQLSEQAEEGSGLPRLPMRSRWGGFMGSRSVCGWEPGFRLWHFGRGRENWSLLCQRRRGAVRRRKRKSGRWVRGRRLALDLCQRGGKKRERVGWVKEKGWPLDEVCGEAGWGEAGGVWESGGRGGEGWGKRFQ